MITTVRPDGELYRPWNSPLYQPFWTSSPTFEHIRYLFTETLFATWTSSPLGIPVGPPVPAESEV